MTGTLAKPGTTIQIGGFGIKKPAEIQNEIIKKYLKNQEQTIPNPSQGIELIYKLAYEGVFTITDADEFSVWDIYEINRIGERVKAERIYDMRAATQADKKDFEKYIKERF